jgi:hypothetical protein
VLVFKAGELNSALPAYMVIIHPTTSRRAVHAPALPLRLFSPMKPQQRLLPQPRALLTQAQIHRIIPHARAEGFDKRH